MNRVHHLINAATEEELKQAREAAFHAIDGLSKRVSELREQHLHAEAGELDHDEAGRFNYVFQSTLTSLLKKRGVEIYVWD